MKITEFTTNSTYLKHLKHKTPKRIYNKPGIKWKLKLIRTCWGILLLSSLYVILPLFSGFPPGVTVDELKKYRRRRQISDSRPKDNLQPEEGSLKSYQSEYKRHFRAYEPVYFGFDDKYQKAREIEEKGDPTPKESFGDLRRERSVPRRPPCNLELPKEQPMESATEKNSQYVPYVNPERRRLLRKSTALKPEGEMTSETEVRCQFREYENPEKTLPIRRPPSLRLEGDFETLTSEQKEKFIGHILGERPVLKKKNTLLKMEGEFDFLTEKQVSYVRHGNSERLRTRKRSTSLKLNGEVEFFPEYKSCYVDFPRSRPLTYKPTENLRNEGDIESQTETKTKFIDFREFPVSLPARPVNNLQTEGGLDIRPEYKENFVDFPRSRPFTLRPENHLKQEGDFEMKTENNEELAKILNVDAKRPLRVRRPSNLKLEGELQFSTEKSDMFKGHEVFDRLPPARREGNLLLEGEFDFKTEKGEKYVFSEVPEPSDFRKRSSFLRSGGEFPSILDGRRSPRQPLSPNRTTEGQAVRSKLIPYRTEYYGLNGEIADNCSRRTSRRNSKRLKENFAGEMPLFAAVTNRRQEGPEAEREPEKSPESRGNIAEFPASVGPSVPPTDNLRLDPLDYAFGGTKKASYEKLGDTDTPSEDASDVGSVANQQPSFRLEVYNVDANPQGFHKSTRRIFPAEGIPTDTVSVCPNSFLEKKRNDYYGKSVNCPDIPNYMLDKNNNRRTSWDANAKCGDATVDVLNENSAILAVKNGRSSPLNTAIRDGETEMWSRPDWLTA
ncbi:UNVERIFIED_CONTAM: hypothetical protein PYX00_008734 [Menopon gallinae]|uniref:Uncharacterized protein n=1 Tax=Menopon gallinae TaxID=328185 RepID=A0AAW2HPG1_9NEOP